MHETLACAASPWRGDQEEEDEDVLEEERYEERYEGDSRTAQPARQNGPASARAPLACPILVTACLKGQRHAVLCSMDRCLPACSLAWCMS